MSSYRCADKGNDGVLIQIVRKSRANQPVEAHFFHSLFTARSQLQQQQPCFDAENALLTLIITSFCVHKTRYRTIYGERQQQPPLGVFCVFCFGFDFLVVLEFRVLSNAARLFLTAGFMPPPTSKTTQLITQQLLVRLACTTRHRQHLLTKAAQTLQQKFQTDGSTLTCL